MAFLADLPSFGTLTKVSKPKIDNAPPYICTHATDPPEGQVIRTDSTDILIRNLNRVPKQQVGLKRSATSQGGTAKRPRQDEGPSE